MRVLFLAYDAWGDWISYNGLIRYLSKNYEKVFINLNRGIVRRKFVEFLFRDDTKIQIYDGQDYDVIVDAQTYHEPNYSGYNRKNKLGELYSDYTLDPLKDPLPSNPSCFYQYLGLSDDIRKDYFYFSRMWKEENDLFNKLNLTKNEYDVICETSEMKINPKYYGNKRLVNIHNISSNFVDTVKVIECAREVHLVDTAPSLFVYHLQYKKLMGLVAINFHSYARKGARSCDGVNNNNIFTEYNKYHNNNLRCINAMLTPKLDNWNFIWE
jgi:hypothetical protein